MRGRLVWQDVMQPTRRLGLIKKARQADLLKAIGTSGSDLFEDQRTVGAAEAEGVTQGVLHTANLTRFVRNEVQIAT
jgi:hypothetical protein